MKNYKPLWREKYFQITCLDKEFISRMKKYSRNFRMRKKISKVDKHAL